MLSGSLWAAGFFVLNREVSLLASLNEFNALRYDNIHTNFDGSRSLFVVQPNQTSSKLPTTLPFVADEPLCREHT